MNYNDLSNFTYEELSNFTHAQLMLGKLELLEEANSNPHIPDELMDKLYELSNQVLSKYNNPAIVLPKNKKNLTWKDIVTFMGYAVTIKEFTKMSLDIIEFLINIYIS